MNIEILIQARYRSTRLPGKALADIGGVPILGRVVERAQAAGVGPVLVCTGSDPANDPIRAWCASAGVACASPAVADEEDVLSRLLCIAEQLRRDDGTALYLRVTADCPLLDPAAVRAVATVLQQEPWDYAATSHPRTGWREGIGEVEGFSFRALAEAHAHTCGPEREHATRWLRRGARGWTRSVLRLADVDRAGKAHLVREFPTASQWSERPGYSVDDAASLERVRGLYAALGERCGQSEIEAYEWRQEVAG